MRPRRSCPNNACGGTPRMETTQDEKSEQVIPVQLRSLGTAAKCGLLYTITPYQPSSSVCPGLKESRAKSLCLSPRGERGRLHHRGEKAAADSLSPSAFACECGHSQLQARQGELAGRGLGRGSLEALPLNPDHSSGYLPATSGHPPSLIGRKALSAGVVEISL